MTMPRWRGALVAAGLALVTLAACTPVVSPPARPPTTRPPSTACTAGPVAARAVAVLREFTGWLRREGVAGVIGEVGWPTWAPTWNAVGERWFRAADAARVGAISWATGEWWQTTYPLSPYVASSDGSPVNTARLGAAVLEAHLATAPWRGISVAGAEFGTPGPLETPTARFSNAKPGTDNDAYHYDQAGTFTYLWSRGIRLVRLPFRWERIQPQLGQPLDPDELGRLQVAVGHANAAGLQVILDVHNFGAYWLDAGGNGVRQPVGSTAAPSGAFADLWTRLATAFAASSPSAVAYGLMAEPVELGGATERADALIWESVSQEAVSAIRTVDTTHTILVPGSEWSAAHGWARRHPVAWITDPAGKTIYEAHQYFDADSSGHYQQSYATEVQQAAAAGWSTKPC
jgi:hypothetical protein